MCHSKIIYLLLSAILLFYFNCEKSSVRSDGIISDQVAIVLVYYNSSYLYNEQTVQKNLEPTTHVWGTLIADSTTTIEYFKAGGCVFDDKSYFNYDDGVIYFGTLHTPLMGNVDPLEVEVKTSQGTLSGSVTIPDTIDTAYVSHSDTLRVNEPLTVYWDDTGADFFAIDISCSFTNSNSDDERVSAIAYNSPFTFSGTSFANYRKINYFFISSFNGSYPLIASDSTYIGGGNMNGTGKGFLFNNNSSAYFYGSSIIIGSDSNTFSSEKCNEIKIDIQNFNGLIKEIQNINQSRYLKKKL